MNSDNLKLYLKSFNIITDKEIDSLLQVTTVKNYNKSDYFIKEEETCKHVSFVLSGIFRSYYISDKGEEITYCITFPNNFMTAYSSYLLAEPSKEIIQAITPAEILLIQKKDIEILTQRSPNWNIFLKIMAEQQYIALEQKIFQLQKSDASKRYTNLINNHPEYVQKIPLQYLASYLGITQRHLSRIRKENTF